MDYLDNLLELAGANEKAVVFKDKRFQTALIGYGANKRAIYDYDIMVDSVAATENISIDSAKQIVDDAIVQYCNSVYSPIVMYHFSYERPKDNESS